MSKDRSTEVTLQAATQPAFQPAPRPAPDLERIFRENHDLVFRSACRVLGNAADAEDVLQTVFLRLLRREGGEPLDENVASYLRRAAVNGALDLLRARARSRSTPLEDVAHALVDEAASSPEQRPYRRELRERLRAAIARLSPAAAEMFVLRYLEGYANKEIARMLRARRTTVAVTLHRARKRLQEELRPLREEEPSPGAGGRP
jgi:RNA polymerase sigma-70 factor (ECF subfamily)